MTCNIWIRREREALLRGNISRSGRKKAKGKCCTWTVRRGRLRRVSACRTFPRVSSVGSEPPDEVLNGHYFTRCLTPRMQSTLLSTLLFPVVQKQLRWACHPSWVTSGKLCTSPASPSSSVKCAGRSKLQEMSAVIIVTEVVEAFPKSNVTNEKRKPCKGCEHKPSV